MTTSLPGQRCLSDMFKGQCCKSALPIRRLLQQFENASTSHDQIDRSCFCSLAFVCNHIGSLWEQWTVCILWDWLPPPAPSFHNKLSLDLLAGIHLKWWHLRHKASRRQVNSAPRPDGELGGSFDWFSFLAGLLLLKAWMLILVESKKAFKVLHLTCCGCWISSGFTYVLWSWSMSRLILEKCVIHWLNLRCLRQTSLWTKREWHKSSKRHSAFTTLLKAWIVIIVAGVGQSISSSWIMGMCVHVCGWVWFFLVGGTVSTDYRRCPKR